MTQGAARFTDRPAGDTGPRSSPPARYTSGSTNPTQSARPTAKEMGRSPIG